MEPRLMAGKRDVLAQLFEKLALAAAERLLLPPRGYQHTKHLVFHDQRGDDQGPEAGSRKPLRKRELNCAHVGLIDEITRDAPGKAVLIDRHQRSVGQAEGFGESAPRT